MEEHVFSSFFGSLSETRPTCRDTRLFHFEDFFFFAGSFATPVSESLDRARRKEAFARPIHGRRGHVCVAGAALMMARDGTRGTPSPFVLVALLFDRRDRGAVA